MTEARRNNVVQILRYATMLNNKKTRKELTGDKPTVFVTFNGHVNALEIDIYSEGWVYDLDADEKYYIDLDGNVECDFSECYVHCSNRSRVPADELLTNVLNRLKTLYNEWRAK